MKQHDDRNDEQDSLGRGADELEIRRSLEHHAFGDRHAGGGKFAIFDTSPRRRVKHCTACAIAMVVWSRHSDRKGERFWHTALPALAAAMGLAASGYAGSPTTAMLSLSVAATGTLAAMPPFWTLPTAFLSGLGAAVGIALVNSIGNLAGFFGPYLVGWIKTGATGHCPIRELNFELSVAFT